MCYVLYNTRSVGERRNYHINIKALYEGRSFHKASLPDYVLVSQNFPASHVNHDVAEVLVLSYHVQLVEGRPRVLL